jgi:hypothetical protein
VPGQFALRDVRMSFDVAKDFQVDFLVGDQVIKVDELKF